MDTNKIVYIQIDTWYDSDLSYLQELEDEELEAEKENYESIS